MTKFYLTVDDGREFDYFRIVGLLHNYSWKLASRGVDSAR